MLIKKFMIVEKSSTRGNFGSSDDILKPIKKDIDTIEEAETKLNKNRDQYIIEYYTKAN